MTNLKVPIFTKDVRDKILNFTDDKEHNSFVKLLDGPYLFKAIMGAKNVSKSFGCMINCIWRLVNEPNYNAIWARNISKDIDRTISPNFKKALDFLALEHNLDFSPFFDIYKNLVVFKPTGQAIYFANFEIANSFAGITLPKTSFDFVEVYCDEIQQNPDELGDTKFSYEKQQKDMDFIIQSTILRTPNKNNQIRSIIFTFNVYDSSHWVCEKFVKPILPFSKQNRELILKQNYLFAESKELNCAVMRMSRFYVPKSTISDDQFNYYETLKNTDPKLYDITVAGEAYDIGSSLTFCPFKNFIFNDENAYNDHLIFKDEIQKENFLLFVDGFDPGLRDKNGFCRIGLTKNYEIVVLYVQELISSKVKNFVRVTTMQKIISLSNALNKYQNLETSILAIDSKDDVIIELACKYCIENQININITKAIKNKNPNFKIDFSIPNRMNFLKECFEKNIIWFTPNTLKLLDYIAKITVDNNYSRIEKINADIYDLINAFEYALSIIYNFVVSNNIEKERTNIYDQQ